MSRLIDADKLKDYIDMQSGRPFIGCTVGDAMKIMIDEQPTIEERKKGEWKAGQCSICGCDVPAYIIDWKWQKDMDANFCPNCGADMRGDGDA